MGVIVGATAAVLALITLVVMLSIYSNGQSGQSTGVRDGDDGRLIVPSDTNIGRL